MADFKKISKFTGPEDSPGYLLWRVSTKWRRVIEEALKPLGLTHPQFVVLATVGWLTRNHENTTQVAVSRQAGLDPNTTSQVLKGLQTKGLIQRVQTTDDRSKHPTLTQKGNEILSKAMPVVEAKDTQFFEILHAKESQFRKCLKDLSNLTEEEI